MLNRNLSYYDISNYNQKVESIFYNLKKYVNNFIYETVLFNILNHVFEIMVSFVEC